MSANFEICSVILLQLDTIGLMPIGFLCIFFKKYSLDVRGFAGGLQKSNQVSLISSFSLSDLIYCVILIQFAKFGNHLPLRDSV